MHAYVDELARAAHLPPPSRRRGRECKRECMLKCSHEQRTSRHRPGGGDVAEAEEDPQGAEHVLEQHDERHLCEHAGRLCWMHACLHGAEHVLEKHDERHLCEHAGRVCWMHACLHGAEHVLEQHDERHLWRSRVAATRRAPTSPPVQYFGASSIDV